MDISAGVLRFLRQITGRNVHSHWTFSRVLRKLAVILRNIHLFILILGLSEVRTHKHSHGHINNDNDDKPSTLNMCTQSLQLKVGLIKKSLMGVHAHYRNICHLQQYLCNAKHLVWAKCVHKSQQQQKAATHSLRFENVSAACITCTAECTVVQRGLKFKCTWSKHSVCTAPQMCVCIVKLNNLCVCLCVNTVPLVLRSVIFVVSFDHTCREAWKWYRLPVITTWP